MAGFNCDACTDLKTNSADFATNGVTTAVCTSLKNNSGFNPSNSHNDCEDLDIANDCLIGNLDSEMDLYDDCDWKPFMHIFIPNIHQMLKSFACAVCGLWSNIRSLGNRVDRVECFVDYQTSAPSFYFGEDSTGQSRLVAGKGVDFKLRSSSEEHSGDIRIIYVAGGYAYLTGSLRTFTESYTDADGNTKSGNSVWDFTANDFALPKGGELLYEVRIKKSEYPQIKSFVAGFAWATGANNQFFEARISVFTQGNYAYGQHGYCDSDGTPSESGYSSGHLVPNGWIYLQVRMFYVAHIAVGNVEDKTTTKRGSNITPAGNFGIRLNPEEIPCN